MRFQTQQLLSLLPALASAIAPPPAAPGMKLVWSDDFAGPAGSPPSNQWNVAEAIDTNNEIQTYSTSSQNLQISGGGTIQLIPRKTASGKWTSSRIETKGSWTPPVGGKMLVQAGILLGSNPGAQKQGIWPAFWMLGDAIRHGTEWPLCGELDILESVSGDGKAYGTAHCGPSDKGGPCNEPTGNGANTALPTDGFHQWGLLVDRSSGDWRAQSITWMLDGNPWRSLKATDINDEGIWATLAHSPFYVLLNVAVGGDWPGSPNAETVDGYGAMMEVQYVAVYST